MKLATSCLLACLLLPGLSLAHDLSVAHVDIYQPAEGSRLTVDVDLAIRDLALSMPLDANGDDKVTWAELTEARKPLEALVQSGVTIASQAGPCTLVSDSLAVRRYDDGAYAALGLTATCPSAQGLVVDYQLLFDQDPQHRALVTLRSGDSASTGIARAGAGRIELSRRSSNPFGEFVREGVRHILIGYDHLAFLVCLLLPAALVRVGSRWEASPGFRSSLLHTLGLVTAFTLAHSVTLSLAALGWVTPASRWIEAAIAFSVLLAALNNLWPVVARRLWLVGFSFGLVHGFGFAGALGELGLPADAKLWALFGFNVGVELGQLAVVTVLFPLLYLLRRKPWYPRAVIVPASLAIAALALYWLWVRLAG